MSQSPLKQFFRRPAIYIKLPSNGVGYGPGSLETPENGEFPVYPMTAIDTITTKTPDALMNGTAVCDIIQSCFPNVKNAWEVKSNDLDAMLIAIQIATNGGELEISSVCPQCEEESKYGVQLPKLLNSIKSNYDKPLRINELQFVFSPLTFREVTANDHKQFAVQRELQTLNQIDDESERSLKSKDIVTMVSNLTLEVIARTIDKIILPDQTVVKDKNDFVEYLKNIDKKTFDTIRDYSISLRRDSQIKPLQTTCVHCGHQYEQPFNLNVSDFFG